jgi:hypothetical protein
VLPHAARTPADGCTWCERSSNQVGNETFLKGKYIEVGIHSVASFGTLYVPSFSH